MFNSAPPVPPGRTDAAVPFRPALRPPIAVLEVMDDDGKTGELIRIATDMITIGRSDANITIPHDSQISAEHARIVRQVVDATYQWVLTDLDSTNGTFVRVKRATLKNGQRFMIGMHRYCFRNAGAAAPTDEQAGSHSRGTTRGWHTVKPSTDNLESSLIRLNHDGTRRGFRLQEPT